MDNETKNEFKKAGDDFKKFGNDIKEKFESKEWKDKMENFGKKMEEKGKEVGEKVEKKVTGPGARRVGYVFIILIYIALFYVANNLLDWNLDWVKGSWLDIIGIFNFSVILTIVLHIIYIINDNRLLYFGGKFVMDIVGILVMYQLFTVMPFDFNGLYNLDWLNMVFPIVMIIGIIGTIIGLFIRTYKFITNKNIYY